jgi:hypothetical protein
MLPTFVDAHLYHIALWWYLGQMPTLYSSAYLTLMIIVCHYTIHYTWHLPSLVVRRNGAGLVFVLLWNPVISYMVEMWSNLLHTKRFIRNPRTMSFEPYIQWFLADDNLTSENWSVLNIFPLGWSDISTLYLIFI